MSSIKEQAESYEAPETKNITELEKVSVNLQTEDKTYNDKEGKPFTVKVVNIDGEDYRVPTSVLKQLKEHLEHKPDLEFFKVNKSGSGLNTTYTVIPL